MNMFARFDENPAMTLRVIKETKRYGRTDGQRENSIPPTNKVCGGYKNQFAQQEILFFLETITHDPSMYRMNHPDILIALWKIPLV